MSAVDMLDAHLNPAPAARRVPHPAVLAVAVVLATLAGTLVAVAADWIDQQRAAA